MESILNELNQRSVWLEFFEYKLEKDHLSKRDIRELSSFIDQKRYESVVSGILTGGKLSIPKKTLVNKLGGGKRVVYSFQDDENLVLKLLAYLLYRYDIHQSEGCYSFRKGFGAQKAIHKIINMPDISGMWCYKLDIKNYFNSISVPILLSVLEPVINDDRSLYEFLCGMLSENKAIYEGEIINENRGVMAGTPTSPFLANIYLKEMDEYFTQREIIYSRYSDDIIIFARTPDELTDHKTKIYDFLNKYELSVNTSKEKTTEPGQAWDYLGIEYRNKQIDLSSSTKMKLKGKIRRKARALRRWKLRKNANDDQAIKVMIRVFNKKFYVKHNSHDLTWSRWFFPLVTASTGFKEIDSYLQQYIRYIPTGSHGKKNYKTTYGKLKELGYRSLVNEYYKFKNNKNV